MFNKILVALDRSPMGKQVFDQALALAKVTGASLMLVHVLSAEEEGSPYAPILSNFDYYPGIGSQSFEYYQKQWDIFKHQGIQILQSFCAQANTAGVNAEYTQHLGSPGRIICQLATSWGADLIVMGRRGHAGLKELFLGSVSNYVLHHAPCSVHVMHLTDVSQAETVVPEKASVT
ncbi:MULTISPECIES: universal stress protein [unclassified Tolypothrix]|uniref:universal stress protein n=1 Tax=unclassified Tolypothrix TaxID=2649714 RepID=UPI0005EAAA14|nr:MULTISPECIES: universal stress protein [unclassified Tolypothrix]BAY93933.1 UspA domain-containing protein [Microchaete diplosiphon NIES-3275]EKF03566.1 universal stress family protein [Tolypothrix sp. PCC 7601]MBE9087008.1 universal stress protein [Tolypothrix sp. LEGE 11397]UYD27711.1 universal stress protein [Tolypothrix sp. PCC 7712]UYD36426.1 universal stress protein [Tolypothrix sp. PCC 7601]